jgi:LmbE family N-acetylglucosaminyl deacetylase
MHRPKVVQAALEVTATRFLRRVHRITHRMPFARRRVEEMRVLVVAPHPDDEAIAIGGCLALHRRVGSVTTSVFVTRDQPARGGRVVRRREAEKASKLLGFDCRFLDVPDGTVSRHERTVSRQLAEIVCATKPDIVFSPFPGDHHRDHQAVAASTGEALTESSFRGEIWCYETWSSLWPNCGVDITDVVEQKRAAIECYQSQLSMPYVDAVLGLNRYRGLKLGVDFAEALFVCRPPRYRALCRTLAVI